MFTETWLPTRDGVVTSLVSFRRALEALGHEVFIFAAGSKEAQAENRDPKVRIFTGPRWSPYPDYTLALRPGPSKRELKELDIDLIHSHGTAFMGVKAMRCARLSHIPLVLTFHTRVEDATSYVTRHRAREEGLRRLIWTWHRWYFHQCAAIITPTRSVEEDLLREVGSGIRKAFVVSTGVDTQRFAGGEAKAWRERLGVGDGRLVVNVGRVAWEKNLAILFEAAERVKETFPSVMFAVGGKGPALEHFQREVQRRGLDDRVRFLGFVPDAELPSLYKAADAFIMTSTFETQGIALLEAMAAGLPAAAADTGGPTDFIDDGVNGFLFNGRDVDACAAAVVRALAANGAVRDAARATAAGFTERGQAEALVRVYEEVLKGPIL